MPSFLLRFALPLTPTAWERLGTMATTSLAVQGTEVVVIAVVDGPGQRKRLAAHQLQKQLQEQLAEVVGGPGLSQHDIESLRSLVSVTRDEPLHRTISYQPDLGALCF